MGGTKTGYNQWSHPWTEKEISLLKAQWPLGTLTTTVAFRLKRTTKAVQSKAVALGLTRTSAKGRTPYVHIQIDKSLLDRATSRFTALGLTRCGYIRRLINADLERNVNG